MAFTEVPSISPSPIKIICITHPISAYLFETQYISANGKYTTLKLKDSICGVSYIYKTSMAKWAI